jgi:membrane-associated phospholipid phosphatase
MAVITNRTRASDDGARRPDAAFDDGPARDRPARREEDRRDVLRHWPLGRRAWKFATAAYLAILIPTAALGLLVVHGLEDGAFGRADVRISEWFADRRTPTLNDVAHTVSFASDSVIVIPVCAVLLVAFAFAFRRWHEAILVIGALLYEKAIFLPATFVADRERPPVGQLAGDPPSSSFFSGHVAAAVAFYFGLYVVVRWHSESRAARRGAAFVASLAVAAVALSRMIEGMHYLSDVIVGAFIGAISLAVVQKALSYDREAPQALTARPAASNVP